MSLIHCNALVPIGRLVDYWLGEIGGDEERQIDEHLFGCDACSRRLQALVGLGDSIRMLMRQGVVPGVISARLLERLMQEGLRVREYRVAPNGSVNCTVAPEDDLLVSRLQAPLGGVKRLDLIAIDLLGPGEARLCEIPFNSRADAVILVPPIDAVRRQPAHTGIMRLLAVDGTDERLLGEYLFHHSPWPAPDEAG
jgi:putative zinc finger protein